MGALDDAALAAFLKRVEGNGGYENSTGLLNRLLAQTIRYMVAAKCDPDRIKARLLAVLEKVGDMADFQHEALESEHSALLVEKRKFEATELPAPKPSPWERVTVKYINRNRGFGFFTRSEGTPDILFTQTVLDRCGVDRLRAGERFDVRWVEGDKGLVAVEVAYPVGFVW